MTGLHRVSSPSFLARKPHSVYDDVGSVKRHFSGHLPGSVFSLTRYFSGGHTFQGQYHTKESDKIEGDIWQAGADPDTMLLGLSFATKDQVLLNTIHIAKPGKVSQTKVDSGIVVKTYPLRIELQ
jgi:hypothetical protein